MKKQCQEMLKIYKPLSGLDWMNYKITRKNDLTFHHIIKKQHGGTLDIDNGALLLPTAHQYLHIIEYKDLKTYLVLNKLFKIINQQMREPTQEQRQIIEYLLCEFENYHRYDKTSKGKVLIKREYLKRGIQNEETI